MQILTSWAIIAGIEQPSAKNKTSNVISNIFFSFNTEPNNAKDENALKIPNFEKEIIQFSAL